MRICFCLVDSAFKKSTRLQALRRKLKCSSVCLLTLSDLNSFLFVLRTLFFFLHFRLLSLSFLLLYTRGLWIRTTTIRGGRVEQCSPTAQAKSAKHKTVLYGNQMGTSHVLDSSKEQEEGAKLVPPSRLYCLTCMPFHKEDLRACV